MRKAVQETIRLTARRTVTSDQLSDVATRFGLTPEEEDMLRGAVVEMGWLAGEEPEPVLAVPVEHDLPVPVLRLVDRYLVDGAVRVDQAERLAVLLGLTGGVVTLRAGLEGAGIEVRAPILSSEADEVEETEGTSGDWPDDETEPSSVELPDQVRDGQRAGAMEDDNKALVAARSILAGDRFNARPHKRILSAQEERGLCLLLRQGRALQEELSEEDIRALRPDSEAHQAWTALVLHNQGLVWKSVNAYGDREGEGLQRDDLYQHGMLGLMRALQKFDASRGHKLSTYATWWIRQSIDRGLQNELGVIRLPAHVHETVGRVRRAEKKLHGQGLSASRENLIIETGLDSEKLDLYFRVRRLTDHLDRLVGTVALGEFTHDDRSIVGSPEMALDNRFGRERVEGILAVLSEREADILRRRIGVVDGRVWTLDEIGQRIGVSRERVRQLEGKALKSIRALAVGGSGDEAADLPPWHSPGAAVDHAIRRARTGRSPTGEPRPDARLLVAMRTKGYNLTTALAELVDNSIAAGASTVRVEHCRTPGREWVAVVDDGHGMDEAGLRAAMSWASSHGRQDFGRNGRFGPGLKAASFSQARMLSVLSRGPSGDLGAWTWDIDRMTRDGQWYARQQADRESLFLLEECGFTGQGTVVLWRKTDRLGRGARFRLRLEKAARDLGLIFHRQLETGRTKIFVGDSAVEVVNPYLRSHPATQDRGIEVLEHQGHRILVNPVVLPHPSRLVSDGDQHLAAVGESLAREGFYIYRGDRLVVAGGWLGMPGLEESNETSLARISVTVPPEVAPLWQLDVRQMSARLPDQFAEHLIALAEGVRDRSARVFARRLVEPST